MLQFACACEAERWLQCTPDVKQQDWLGGDVDIVAVSVRALPRKYSSLLKQYYSCRGFFEEGVVRKHFGEQYYY